MTGDLRCRSAVWFDDEPKPEGPGSSDTEKKAGSRGQQDHMSKCYGFVIIIMLPVLFLLVAGSRIPFPAPLSLEIFSLRVTVSTRGGTPKPLHFGSPAPSEAAPAFDHFLFGNGARVIDELTSPSVHVPATSLLNDSSALLRRVKAAVKASAGPKSIPEVALGIYVDRRVLWYFAGARGQLGIAPARPLRIDRVALHNVSTAQAETCVPDQLTLWGLVGVHTDERRNQLSQEFPRRFPPEEMQDVPFLRNVKGFLWVALADYTATAPGGLHRAPSGATSTGLHNMALLQRRGLLHDRTPVYSHAFVLTLERRDGGSDFSCFAGISAFGVLGD